MTIASGDNVESGVIAGDITVNKRCATEITIPAYLQCSHCFLQY